MVEDEEGFEYPQVDESKCVRCYQCIKVCPIKAARAQQGGADTEALRNAMQLDVRENVRFVIEFFQKYQKSYLCVKLVPDPGKKI